MHGEATRSDLQDCLEALVQLAQLMLRDEIVNAQLDSSHRDKRVDFWSAFFQVVLSWPFGHVLPGVENWLDTTRTIDQVRRSKLDCYPHLAQRIQQCTDWCREQVHYAVAQFWNADRNRASAFVINSPVNDSAATPGVLAPLCAEGKSHGWAADGRYWRERWLLMDEINRQAESGVGDNQVIPASIGHFIVTHARQSEFPCPVFALDVGARTHFDAFVRDGKLSVENSAPLQIPTEIVQLLLQGGAVESQLSGPSSGRTLLSTLDAMSSVKQQASHILHITDKANWSVWKQRDVEKYLEYIHAHCKRVFATPGDMPYLRLMLLNNLLMVRRLIEAAAPAQAGHSQYCIPTWHHDTSYLYIVTRRPLCQAQIKVLRQFADRLFSLAWARDSVRKLEEDRVSITQQAERAARAAILARNFSHTVGSHVLNSPGFAGDLVGLGSPETYGLLLRDIEADPVRLDRVKSELTKLQQTFELADVKAFHRYLQGRFDFIARAIEYRRDPLEPLFFIEDLVSGLLRQSTFLDHLVKDLGWAWKDMRFRIYLPRGNAGRSVEFTSKIAPGHDGGPAQLGWSNEHGEEIGEFEVLVGIAGGTTGMHAFYAILENIIRNSFKYGRDAREGDDAKYVLHFRLTHADGAWRLQLWDSFSTTQANATQDSVYGRLQRLLDERIVDKNAALLPDGLGLKEMQLCARSLSGAGCERAAISLCNPERLASACPPAELHRRADGSVPLVYEMRLEEPVLLAVYRGGSCNHYLRVRHFDELTKLAESGAHLAVFCGEDITEEFIGELAEQHAALPYRVLVACRDESEQQRVQPLLQQHLPPRRMFCTIEDIDGRSLHSLLTESHVRGPAAEDLICTVWEIWLRAWKGPSEGQWHLWIGFERTPEAVEATWGRWLTRIDSSQPGAVRSRFGSQLVTIWVRSCMAGEKVTWVSNTSGGSLSSKQEEDNYWQREYDAAYPNKRALVFDNHGACFDVHMEHVSDYRQGPRYYQRTSGSSTFEFSQRLDHPPTTSFGFRFFIYSLLESSLMQVAVADERLAASLLFDTDPDHQFRAALGEQQQAGVFPVFQFRHQCDTSSAARAQYSSRHGATLRAVLNSYPEVLASEGLELPSTTHHSSGALQLLVPKQEVGYEVLPAVCSGAGASRDCVEVDVLIVHEGAVDMLRTNDDIQWNEEVSRMLTNVAPRVVRTSGRGRHSRNLGDALPFIEASVLSAAIVISRNKYDLSRTLLGAVGSPVSHPAATSEITTMHS